VDSHVRTTTRADGNFADHARLPAGTTWLRQVHGARVVVVGSPGEHAGERADAAVTATPGCALAVRTADCAPIVVRGEGVVGIVHAGWRGLEAGVVEEAVAALRRLGAGTVLTALLGPCIRPECYEFGVADLDRVAARLGGGVRSRSASGHPALDLGAAVTAALAAAGIDAVTDDGECTSCLADRYYSHRARAEAERMATIAWLTP
jgi:YfiH family protein